MSTPTAPGHHQDTAAADVGQIHQAARHGCPQVLHSPSSGASRRRSESRAPRSTSQCLIYQRSVPRSGLLDGVTDARRSVGIAARVLRCWLSNRSLAREPQAGAGWPPVLALIRAIPKSSGARLCAGGACWRSAATSRCSRRQFRSMCRGIPGRRGGRLVACHYAIRPESQHSGLPSVRSAS